ncbi:MAG: tetratricopeptide repeat protein, partial [Candidatus Magnetominusculus sp. LBB02]|nr:tetratricopeptide repeat protein [Candidatus Magnetominusculus sp. LBB02]
FPKDIKYGIMPGDFSASIIKDDCRFGFIGLNSAFLHLADETTKHDIAVDLHQFNNVCATRMPDTLSWLNENDINFLVTHHPPDWLTGGDNMTAVHRIFREDIAPTGRFHAHLFGHGHEHKLSISSMGGIGFRREYQGVSLCATEKTIDGKERLHGYSVGKLLIEDGQGTIWWWPRKRIHREIGCRIEADHCLILPGGVEHLESDIFRMARFATAPAPEPETLLPTHTSTVEILGRTGIVDEVTGLLRGADKRRLITLLGAPGIGKTSIAQKLREIVAGDFKDGVYFCSFQGIEGLDALIATINADVAHTADAKEETLFQWLGNKECLLILDNFEDPLEKDRSNVQGFLRRLLEKARRVKLLITTRDAVVLTGIEKVIKVKELERAYSEELTRKLAGDLGFADRLKGKDLKGLLDELGDVPLAIVLAAPSLNLGVDNLTRELQNQNLDILREYGTDETNATKDQSLRKSLLLSYSKILDFNDRLLFLVCSLFPAGLKQADALIILPAISAPNYQSLLNKSLITTADGNTYTMLAPIRTYAYDMFKKMIAEKEIDAAIERRWIALCLGKSKEYYNTVRGKGKRAVKELINELPDMFRVLEYLISKSEKDDLLDVLLNLTDFARFVGITKEVMSSLEKAKEIAKNAGDILGEANCIFCMGDVHLGESRNEDALKAFKDALPLFKQVGDILGEANCIRSMGDVHFRESRNEDALKAYEAALPLYQKVGDILGEANCIKGMGDVHLRESRNEDALKAYEDALPLFKQVGDISGEANCIRSMGDVHFRESRNEDALKAYEDALPLYQKVSGILGEANCIASLGLCSIRAGQIEAGVKEVFRAIGLFEKINSTYSIAVAYYYLGDELMKIKGYQERGVEYMMKAKEIYNSIPKSGGVVDDNDKF